MRKRALLAALLLPFGAQARDAIRIVGSSTVFPFTAAAAEQFGRTTHFRTPIVESTGTGGGFKLFCEGTGDDTPDLSDASRPIKPSELAQCHARGVTAITEIPLGYDGIVFANARTAPEFQLSKRSLFLAMARLVPRDGTLVPNFYTRWRQIDPSLPDLGITVYGPPPAEGTRDALVELVMEAACKGFPEYGTGDTAKPKCDAMREDGRFIELLGGNLMVQKLANNPDALAIFGYNYLEQNAGLVKAASIDGVAPSVGHIIDGSYGVARLLYIYAKNAHLATVPGMREFLTLLASDAATGEDGYLVTKGLLPLPKAQHDAAKQKIPLPPAAEVR